MDKLGRSRSRSATAACGTGCSSSASARHSATTEEQLDDHRRTRRAGRSSSGTPRLTDAQLGEMMRLIAGADSVELKATVSALAASRHDPGPADGPGRGAASPDVLLRHAGPRAQQARGSSCARAGARAAAGDTVIKLRPVVPADLPASLRKQADFNVEVDVLPGGFVCSASFKGRADGAEIRRAVAGKLPLRRLFSKTQREFYRDHAPEGIELDSLVAAGPDVHPQDPLRRPDRHRQEGAAALARRRDVAVPGRLPDPRALDQVPARRMRSRSRSRRGPTSSSTGSTSAATSRRRRRRRSSSTLRQLKAEAEAPEPA